MVEAHIRRIEQVNPRLNAMVCDRFDEARAEAAAADAARSAEAELPLLHGVPCTIKESIALSGMPHSSGVLARRGVRAEQDATPVERLRTAGAIPLGVTNLPELASDVSTSNKLYGRTNNVYDARHSAGGSSGGEGALVGSGGSPFGIGTDIGGSIRIPAFCNGVFGHKPTGGLVPCSGQVPASRGIHQRFNTTGPIARRAGDLMPILRVIAGPDGRDTECRSMSLGDPEKVELSGLRVFVVGGDGRLPRVTGELRDAQQRAATALGRGGADVSGRVLDGFKHSQAILAAMMLEQGYGPMPEDLGEGAPVSAGRELLKWCVGRSAHTFPPLILSALSRLGTRFPRWIERNARRGRALRDEIEQLLDDRGVLLYPTARGPAPLHRRGGPPHFRFTGIFNVLELPSTQVPLGLSPSGLPLGVQVVARRAQDHLCIAVALELERALGGWVPPAGREPTAASLHPGSGPRPRDQGARN